MSFSSRVVVAEGKTLQFSNCYWNSGEKLLSFATLGNNVKLRTALDAWATLNKQK